jgi:hypothetical protein
MSLFFLRLVIAANVSVGGEFVSWNKWLGDEKTCVSARDISDALEKLPNFIGKTVGRYLFVFVHLHKMMIFEDTACVVADDGSNEVIRGVRGWRDSFQEDAFSCKCIPVTKWRWTSAKCRCGHEFFCNDAIDYMRKA